MNKKKIAIATTTRADYGILTPLIGRIRESGKMEMHLMITGTHLSREFGYTADEIEQTQPTGNFVYYHNIPILTGEDSPEGVSGTVANAISGFSRFFAGQPLDLLILLGDRTETLGIAIAAMNQRIPIAHIHGGERTEGAVDESVRHALTKMSHLHFTAAKEYRKRVIQLGENPETVFNVGAMGVENALHTKFLSLDKLRQRVGLEETRPFVIVTCHPVTLEAEDIGKSMEGILGVIRKHREYQYIITRANADAGGRQINKVWEEFCMEESHCLLVSSLGMELYLTGVKECEMVMGNSSSGIIEVPSFGKPTVNIGDRQRGRVMAKSVINCGNTYEDIEKAMEEAKEGIRTGRYREVENPYGDGTASEKIYRRIEEKLEKGSINIKKEFYDCR